jgi:hypothetical protein
MYAYREYLTLAEAAGVLGVDEQTLVQRAIKPSPNISFPKLGFRTYASGFVFCRDKVREIVPQYCMTEFDDQIVQQFISDIAQRESSDITLFLDDVILYLTANEILKISQGKKINIGRLFLDIPFSESVVFYEGAIEVELPKRMSLDQEDKLATFFTQCHSVYYSNLGGRTLDISDLVVLGSEVYECKKQIESNFRSPNRSHDLAELQEKQIANLTEKLSDIGRLFDPRMQRVLKPIAEVIHRFYNSELHQKFQEKKAVATLSKVKEWVKCNSEFNDDRAAEVIKNLINDYYKLKNL